MATINLNDIAIDAKTLGGYSEGSFVNRNTMIINNDLIVKIDLSDNCACLVSICASNNGGQGMIAVSGYGVGTGQRITVASLMKPLPCKIYLNGPSENGTIYIQPVYNNNRISVSWLLFKRGVFTVSSLPSDVTDITSSVLNSGNQISSNMQLTDLQSQMGGGITAFAIGDYAVTVQQKGGQRNGNNRYRRPFTGSPVCKNSSYSRWSFKYGRLVRCKSKSGNGNLPYLYCYEESPGRWNRRKHNTYPLQQQDCSTDIYYSPNSQNLYPSISKWRVGFLDKTGFYNRGELITSRKEVVA